MEESVKPDAYAIALALKACGSQLALNEGRQIHGQVLKLQFGPNRSIKMKLMELYGKCGEFEDARQLSDGMLERDVGASTVMICCYFDHGLIEEACDVFDCVQIKDTVCWTAMIDGFVRNGQMNEALELFRKMQTECETK